MKVLKFGGTSVGTIASLTNVKAIVEGCRGEQAIVVVSALGGLTDKLIATSRLAASGQTAEWRESHSSMVGRHREIIAAMIPDNRRAAVENEVGALLDSLAEEFSDIEKHGEVDTEASDRVVSFGERMSSVIVTNMLDDAVRFDSLDFIKTITRYGRHALDNDASQPLIHAAFDNWDGAVAVVPGFIARESTDGHITNLGRGGSDYTAAILAAALGARVLEIWTDVDGFMTADPRVIPTAEVVGSMSFVEAMDLCNFGAKVIYPPTIYPVFHKNIPIYIKNTFNAEAPGTRVAERTGRADEEGGFKGVSSTKGQCMIILEGNLLQTVDSLENRMLNAPGREGIDVFPINLYPYSATTVALSVKEDAADRAVKTIRDEFSEEIEQGGIREIKVMPGMALVAVVGRDLMKDISLRSRIFELLSDNGMTIEAFSREASDTNLSFLISGDSLQPAMRIIHDTMLAECPSRPIAVPERSVPEE